MKNYVIINGTNSNTLTGLMINELPPITKPEMRTQVEEIDGRDGDIITKLGYSAYDKTITIGLFGTGYDVDNIIKFFNKEGTIVFSNEPDKYYNFTQVNGFDIERLLKFKTASITFHCQPFKYPTTETQKIIQPTILTSDGESITINNTASNSLKLSLKGNTSQTGTPTPTSPIPVSVVSGDNDVVVCGKNLLSIENSIVQMINGTSSYEKGNNYLKASGSVDWMGLQVKTYLKAGTYYYKHYTSLDSENVDTNGIGTFRINKNDLNGEIVFNQNTGINVMNAINSATFTIPNDGIYAFIYRCGNGGISQRITNIKDIILSKSSTDYEPYQGASYSVNLSNGMELCKIGDYQDYFYKDSGKWYLHKEIDSITLDKSYFEFKGTTGTNAYYIETNINGKSDNSIATAMSDKFGMVSFNNRANGLDATYSQNGKIVIRTKNNTSLDWSSNDKCKDWLDANTPLVKYILSTPTTTEITNTTLISQLDALESAMSYKGQTNISQTNNDKPFIISASAVQSGTNEITINNIGNIYSKPLIALEGNGNVDIYLDDTQILKANVESKMNIDINTLEAYNPDTSALLNRQVIGNYNSMTFQPGNNKLTINGALNKATITNYTRWL